MANEKEKKQVKRPTAQKRDIRNNKKMLVNKAYKSKIRTTLRRFEEVVEKGEKGAIQEQLNAVYSVMDRGVKRGLLKLNNASRKKQRLTAKALAKMS